MCVSATCIVGSYHSYLLHCFWVLDNGHNLPTGSVRHEELGFLSIKPGEGAGSLLPHD